MDSPLGVLSEDGLMAASEHQLRLIAERDEEGFAEFLHPRFIINGPMNRCSTREEVLRLFAAGALSHEQYERNVEAVSLAGHIGVIMGEEPLTPAEGTPLAAAFGTSPLKRRFSDLYVFEDGRWFFFARQASVVRDARAPATLAEGTAR